MKIDFIVMILDQRSKPQSYYENIEGAFPIFFSEVI